MTRLGSAPLYSEFFAGNCAIRPLGIHPPDPKDHPLGDGEGVSALST